MPTETNDPDERLVALELKLMDLERTVETLDAALLRQRADIEALRAECARLEARLDGLGRPLDTAAPPEEPPPHY